MVYCCLKDATERCFKDLFDSHDENFYYCTLVMQECSTPYVSAWSFEALCSYIRSRGIDINDKSCFLDYKWSYADSPYCGYKYDIYFVKVERLFNEIEHYSESDYYKCINVWIKMMEKVMGTLDENDLFGRKKYNMKTFINAEVMPFEDSNYYRAQRLNPRSIFQEWIDDINFNMESICNEELDYISLWHPKQCSVILVEKITDKQQIIKIKELFGNNDTLQMFYRGCLNPPYIVSDNISKKEAIEIIKNNIFIEPIVKVLEK